MMMTLEMTDLMMMIILMMILTITLMMMIPSTVNVCQRRGDVIAAANGANAANGAMISVGKQTSKVGPRVEKRSFLI